MKKLTLLLVILPFITFAQISENFNDGEFFSNPSWAGDTSKFKINNNYQLQLDGNDSDTSILFLQTNISGDMEWNIWVKLSFSPSDNNCLKIYLMADNENLKAPLNGYFIKIGESGSDDSIDLFRQDSLTSTKIIDGLPGTVSLTSNTFNLKVIRNSQSNWEILSDITTPGIYSSEGICNDSTYYEGSVFGILC